MFLIITHCKRFKNLIHTVCRTPAILTGSHVCNNLRHLCRCSLNRMRTFNLCISDFKSVRQHFSEINQTAIRHRTPRSIVKIMIMNVAAKMRFGNMFRHQAQSKRFANRSRGQIALRIENVAVLIGIFMHKRRILLLKPCQTFSRIRLFLPFFFPDLMFSDETFNFIVKIVFFQSRNDGIIDFSRFNRLLIAEFINNRPNQFIALIFQTEGAENIF